MPIKTLKDLEKPLVKSSSTKSLAKFDKITTIVDETFNPEKEVLKVLKRADFTLFAILLSFMCSFIGMLAFAVLWRRAYLKIKEESCTTDRILADD